MSNYITHIEVTDRIAIAQQHADIAYYVVGELMKLRLLPKALGGKAYHRCRALLLANPSWNAETLYAHCLDAYEERANPEKPRLRNLIPGGEAREVSLAEQYDTDNAPSSFERSM